MYENIVITGVGIYHPENQVDNNFFINHFSKMDLDVKKMLEDMGRDQRYLSNQQGENVITMGKEAALEAFDKSNINPEDIDMLIFATDSPEYMCPSNALMLNAELKTINANLSFDINTNCTGMLYAMDIAYKMMRGSDKVNKVLIVGSLLASLIASEKDPAIYANFADSGAAIVIEKIEESTKRGFQDFNCKTDPFVKDGFLMPKKGLSQIYNEDICIDDKKLQLEPFDASFVPDEWVKLINEIIENNNYTIQDIKHFLFSQYAKSMGEQTLEILGLTPEYNTFVGDRYGYTGVTSPILAYYHALEDKKIQSNDNIIFCTVGAGFNAMAVLYQV